MIFCTTLCLEHVVFSIINKKPREDLQRNVCRVEQNSKPLSKDDREALKVETSHYNKLFLGVGQQQHGGSRFDLAPSSYQASVKMSLHWNKLQSCGDPETWHPLHRPASCFCHKLLEKMVCKYLTFLVYFSVQPFKSRLGILSQFSQQLRILTQ